MSGQRANRNQQNKVAFSKFSEKVETNYDELNTIIKSYQINQIESWLPAASNNDYDGEIYLNFIDQKNFIRAKISAMEIKWVPGIFGGDLNKEMTEHYNNIREELLKLVPEE